MIKEKQNSNYYKPKMGFSIFLSSMILLPDQQSLIPRLHLGVDRERPGEALYFWLNKKTKLQDLEHYRKLPGSVHVFSIFKSIILHPSPQVLVQLQ